MKLKECGEIYKLNSDNLIVNPKDNEAEVETSGVLSYIIDSISALFHYEPRSVYLRGSLIDKSLSDSTVVDLDLVFVYENTDYSDLCRTWNYTSMALYPYNQDSNKLVITDERKTIEDGIYEIVGKHVELDLNIYSEESFMDQYIHRFQSKKIYGEGLDLSVSHLSRDILLHMNTNEVLPYRKQLCFNKISNLKDFLYKNATFEGDVRDRLIRSMLKVFFRKYSFDLLLRKNSFSKDIYYCYSSILGAYPYYSNHLEDILDLFLNAEMYTTREVRFLVSKLEYLILEIELSNSVRI